MILFFKRFVLVRLFYQRIKAPKAEQLVLVENMHLHRYHVQVVSIVGPIVTVRDVYSGKLYEFRIEHCLFWVMRNLNGVCRKLLRYFT